MQSWSVNTHKQYQPYVAQWLEFCSGRQSNPYDPPIGTVLDFLVALHEKGLKYPTLKKVSLKKKKKKKQESVFIVQKIKLHILYYIKKKDVNKLRCI